MPFIPRIIRQRQKRRMAARRNPGLPAGLGGSLIFSLLFVASSLGLAFFYVDLTRDLPSPDGLSALLDPPHGILLQPTRLYDRDESHILLELEDPAARASRGENRRYLPLNPSTTVHLPEELAEATVATADPGFWSHLGFTPAGFIRRDQPTLAQRLVSDLLLWNEPAGLRRDLRERLLAAQITARFGREKILEWYLNSAKYGHLVYGADAAARAYFDKPIEILNLAEVALLAAVAQAPDLNPLEVPQVPLERQKAVIQAMLDQGFITPEQAAQANQHTLRFREQIASRPEPAPVFTNLVLEQLSARFPIGWIERGGLRIRTSLDYDLQIQANCTVQAELTRRDENTPAQGNPSAEDGIPCEAARLLPTIPLSTGVEVDGLAAVIVELDPRTGEVLVMVGNPAPGMDPAHLPGSPPGTLLTPFIYLTAFTRGWSPASLFWDIPDSSAEAEISPSTLPDGDLPARQPLTLDVYHGPVSLRSALANDYISPAIGLLSQIGPEHVWRIAQQLGLESLELAALQKVLADRSLLIEGEITLLEAAQAFGVFANGGVLAGQILEESATPVEFPPMRPITILKMEGIDHQVWLDCQEQFINCSPQVRPVLSPQLAYLLTHVMSDETARWPSLKHPNPLEIGRPAGAKLGLTGGNGAWVMGFTPQIVTGVWVGTTNRPDRLAESAGGEPESTEFESDLTLVTSASKRAMNSAAALWHATIQYTSRFLLPQNWSAPPGISSIDVCEPSGMLPTETCPSIVNEVFITGNEPTYPDTLYRVFQVNRETGRLATVFTPPALVEDRVFMVVPPQAQTWARSAGLPMPPEMYDVISLAPAVSPGVQIESPAMFAYVTGKVQITGSAGGKDFAFFRIQAGQGLNPQQWLQIGTDTDRTVEEGLLGEWDTTGLRGLYALQLLVVRKDQRVDSAIVQVTIDNQPPELKIIQPGAGQVLSISPRSAAVFEAQAGDDLALEQVEFYIDGQWVVTLSQPPFLFSWKLSPGRHTLLVRAIDLAGNESKESLDFEVKS